MLILPAIMAGASLGALGASMIVSARDIYNGYLGYKNANDLEALAARNNDFINSATEFKKKDLGLLCSSSFDQYANLFPTIINTYIDMLKAVRDLQTGVSWQIGEAVAYPVWYSTRVLTGNTSPLTPEEWRSIRNGMNCPPLQSEYPVDYQRLDKVDPMLVNPAAASQSAAMKWLLVGGSVVVGGIILGKLFGKKGKPGRPRRK